MFRSRETTLDRWAERLHADWDGGCRNGAELWRRLRDRHDVPVHTHLLERPPYGPPSSSPGPTGRRRAKLARTLASGGQVTTLKLVKRQMYGRGKLDLLCQGGSDGVKTAADQHQKCARAKLQRRSTPMGSKVPRSTVLTPAEEAIMVEFAAERCYRSTMSWVACATRSRTSAAPPCIVACNGMASLDF